MITIKGWTNRKDMCIVSKACEHIDVSTAVEMLEAAKTDSTEGRIRLPGGKMFEYNRNHDGRIVIRQIA